MLCWMCQQGFLLPQFRAQASPVRLIAFLQDFSAGAMLSRHESLSADFADFVMLVEDEMSQYVPALHAVSFFTAAFCCFIFFDYHTDLDIISRHR